MRLAVLTLFLVWPIHLVAQESDEDRGFLTGLLERSLGGEGRTVQIYGFTGAFSSEAKIEKINILDDNGIWLTLNNLSITWTRSALLRGRIEIAKLKVFSINLKRKPLPKPSKGIKAEANQFKLPELPAALVIENMNIDSITIGTEVVGEKITLSLTGDAQLANGAGDIRLQAKRIDGQSANLDFVGDFENQTSSIKVDLRLVEAADGFISRIMEVPDRPSLELEVKSEGSLDNLLADLTLKTNDQIRLHGTLKTVSDSRGSTDFDFDLNGDITTLLLKEYAEFFGPKVQFVAHGARSSDGTLSLDELTVKTKAMNLKGQAVLDSNFWPILLDIKGEVFNPSGEAVLLPSFGEPIQINYANLDVDYNTSSGDELKAQINIQDFSSSNAKAKYLVLDLDGLMQANADTVQKLIAGLTLKAIDFFPSNQNVATALGSTIQGKADINYISGEPLQLTNINLSGANWNLEGKGKADTVSGVTFDTSLISSDLSSFSGLTGVALKGTGTLRARGKALLGGFFNIQVNGKTENLTVGVPELDTLLAGSTTLDLAAERNEQGIFFNKLKLQNLALKAETTAVIKSIGSSAKFNIQLLDTEIPLTSLFGSLSIVGTAEQNTGLWNIHTDLSGAIDATADIIAGSKLNRLELDVTAEVMDISSFLPQVSGSTRIIASAMKTKDALQFDATMEGPINLKGKINGQIIQEKFSANYSFDIPTLAPVAPNISEALNITGEVEKLKNGWEFNTNFFGPYGSHGDLVLILDSSKKTIAKYDLSIKDLSKFSPQLPGPIFASGQILKNAKGWQINSEIDAPYNSTGRIQIYFDKTDTPILNYQLNVPDVSQVVPKAEGPLEVNGGISKISNGWKLIANITAPYSITGNLTAKLENGFANAKYTISLPNLSSKVIGVTGKTNAEGSLQQTHEGFDLQAIIIGPSGTNGVLEGRIGNDGILDIKTKIQAQLGLANHFISPRSIVGDADINLTIKGQPALSSIAGKITFKGASLATPNLPFSFNDVNGSISLNGSQANMEILAGVTEGGTIRINGPIVLNNNLSANLSIDLNNLKAIDPQLYTSKKISGTLRFDGPLLNGAKISGKVTIGKTKVQMPSSGISSSGEIPKINNIGTTRPVMRTLVNAGIIDTTAAPTTLRPVFPIDVIVSAPKKIFVKGRGVNAELGGSLRLTGTTQNLVSTGQFDLIRGQVDVLTKRLALTKGSISLQGPFKAFLAFVAETDTPNGSATIKIEGPTDDLVIKFQSTPEAPEDEVLSQIFFGRSISQLSAFQALQMADAVAAIAGRSGVSLIGQLRDTFKLDELNITTDSQGETNLRVGKYLSKNVYSDIVIGGEDGPEVSINVDLTPSITLRGSVETETSDTTIGIFIQNDY